MKTALALVATALVLTACSSPTPRPAAPTRAPTNTTVPPAATPTLGPNYRELRARLIGPLSSLIVSLRQGDTRNASAFLAEFNRAGDEVSAAVQTDTSVPASLLQSAILSVRAKPSDIATLEEVRLRLLTDIT